MKLVCKGAYHNGALHFGEGVIEVDESIAQFLLRDAPENFELVSESAPPETKSLDEPPMDKQIKSAPRKK